MQQTIQPQEELAMIRKIMAESRGQIVDDGKPSIAWGIVVTLGMLYTYWESVTQTTYFSGWVWLGLCALGCLYMLYYVKTKNKKDPAPSFARRVVGAIWGAVGISLIIVIAGTQLAFYFDREVELHPIFICTMTAVVLGIGYYVSSILYEITLLRWVAFGWWASSLVYLFWPGLHSLLIYAVSLVLFQIIPGIVLLRRYKQTHQ